MITSLELEYWGLIWTGAVCPLHLLLEVIQHGSPCQQKPFRNLLQLDISVQLSL